MVHATGDVATEEPPVTIRADQETEELLRDAAVPMMLLAGHLEEYLDRVHCKRWVARYKRRREGAEAPRGDVRDV